MVIGKSRLMGRRDALTMLGAVGALSLVGCGRGSGDTDAGRQPPLAASGRDNKEGGLNLKSIGVLGGLGPQATMDFEARLHQVAQRLIPQRENSGYPPMVLYYHRFPPILLNEDSSPRFPIQPDPRLLEAAKRVGAIVDFMVITSNGAHLVQEQIEQTAGRKVLSMIDVTLEEVRRRQWRKVGVLGFGDPMVYTKPLGEMKLAFETIEGELRGKLDGSIMRVMEGRDDAGSAGIARDAVAALRARGVEGIILGCTEIPLLLGGSASEPDLVNPAQLLAEAAVRYALA
ncbi:MAG TPA: amino acid racemase [Blastocatellia bacterium]|nr:amino acid racemase [Blastocatellia bacterium]